MPRAMFLKSALYALQFFDLEEREALKDLAEDEAVFIDIGANIGALQFFNGIIIQELSSTRILSVEPHPIISRRLAYNASFNLDLPIEPIAMGIGDRDGSMTLDPEHNLGESHF